MSSNSRKQNNKSTNVKKLIGEAHVMNEQTQIRNRLASTIIIEKENSRLNNRSFHIFASATYGIIILAVAIKMSFTPVKEFEIIIEILLIIIFIHYLEQI